jgi:hypothetical protein
MIVFIYAQNDQNAALGVFIIRATIARSAKNAALINSLYNPSTRITNSSYTPRAFIIERVT